MPLSRKTNIFSNFSEKIASTDLADRFEMFQVFWGGLELILVRNGKKKHSYRSWARFFPLIANGSSRIQVATADDKLSPASLVMHTIAPQYFTLPTSKRASYIVLIFPSCLIESPIPLFTPFREIHLIIISKQPRTFRLSIFCYLKIGGGGGARRRKRAAISSPFGGRLISRESGDHRGERVQR